MKNNKDCEKFIKAIEALKEEIEMLKRDALTGAYTRRYLDQVIGEWFLPKFSASKHWIYNVYLFDLNNLHTINRTKGYHEGDKFIVETVNHIREIFKDSVHLIFRIGGDEFVVVSNPSDKITDDILKHPNYTVAYDIWSHNESFHDVMKRLDDEIIKNKDGRHHSEFLVKVDDPETYSKIMELLNSN